MKIAILISGRGSNMAALAENRQGFEICLVAADRPATGLANMPGAMEISEKDVKKYGETPRCRACRAWTVRGASLGPAR